MEAAVEKRWSVTVSDLQVWTKRQLDCQLRAMREKHLFFSAYYGLLVGGYMRCVRLEWRTESTASVHYLHRVLVYEEM